MIHPSAVVSSRARLGRNVRIGPFTVVHDDVVLGDDAVVESHCELGHPAATGDVGPLVLGAGALVRSYSCFYAGSTFGAGLRTGHRVTVREGVRAGERLQLGTLCDLQGHATFGDDVRLHSSVHVGQGAVVGHCVWLYPYVVLTNDPTPPSEVLQGVVIDDHAVVATASVLLPGVRVGARSLVAAHSLVREEVAPDTVVAGAPAKSRGPASAIALRDGSGRPAYPWMRHFHRGYPEALVEQWKSLYPPEPIGDTP